MQTDTKHRNSCQEFEQLLIEETLEPLNREQLVKLQQHLLYCPACQHLQQTLGQMQTTLRIDETNALRPDPAIRSRLIQRIKLQRQMKIQPGLHRRFSLKWLLNYRIPVYQIALSLGVILLLVLGWQQLNFENPPNPAEANPVDIETVFVDSNMVNNTLQLIRQQNGGRNVLEDSAVTKFIKTTM